MVGTLVSFLGVAVLVSLLPGPATALVVRSAAVHGRRSAMLTVLGNSTGILMWAVASVLGISALVAASEAAFWVLKVVGAVVLMWLGARALFGDRRPQTAGAWVEALMAMASSPASPIPSSRSSSSPCFPS